ncbi:MAG: S1 RNA-binding domain-containing protein [Clostridium sp.]|nr:MAG: S1 RNA-binding domain-containing protein [Clostridium sp.]
MAKVVNKMPYGLLLEVAPNVRGLLHKSEFSWNPNDNFDAYCKIGDEIEVAIIAIEPKKERISFSRKAIIDNPWSRVNANVGDLVEATVTKVDQKGVYVTALGVDAFIPAKDAFAENQNGKLDEVYQVGDKVNAVVSTIKPKEWILELSVKKHLANLERKEFQKYMDSEAEEDVSMNLGDLYKDILKKINKDVRICWLRLQL